MKLEKLKSRSIKDFCERVSNMAEKTTDKETDDEMGNIAHNTLENVKKKSVNANGNMKPEKDIIIARKVSPVSSRNINIELEDPFAAVSRLKKISSKVI